MPTTVKKTSLQEVDAKDVALPGIHRGRQDTGGDLGTGIVHARGGAQALRGQPRAASLQAAFWSVRQDDDRQSGSDIRGSEFFLEKIDCADQLLAATTSKTSDG